MAVCFFFLFDEYFTILLELIGLRFLSRKEMPRQSTLGTHGVSARGNAGGDTYFDANLFAGGGTSNGFDANLFAEGDTYLDAILGGGGAAAAAPAPTILDQASQAMVDR